MVSLRLCSAKSYEQDARYLYKARFGSTILVRKIAYTRKSCTQDSWVRKSCAQDSWLRKSCAQDFCTGKILCNSPLDNVLCKILRLW